VTNTGSSPFYYNWPVELSLLDPETHQKVWGKTLEEVNISEWMPGDNWSIEEESYQKAAPLSEIKSSILIDQNLPDGEYIIALSVLDPAGMLPSLRFANENYFEGGYHPMGYIGINKKPARAIVDKSLFYDIQSDKTLKYELSHNSY